MAKTNFQFERRQKDLEKKRKKEEKLKRKADKKDQPGEDGEAVEGEETEGAVPPDDADVDANANTDGAPARPPNKTDAT